MIAVLQVLLFAFMVLLMLFMLLIILLQRGKGGGLVGAFGGMGGNSAFGAKSSDVFMKITVWTAIIWFVVCVAGGYIFKINRKGNQLVDSAPAAAVESSAAPVAEEATPADASAGEAAPADAAAAPTEAPAGDSAPAPEPASEN